jgi:hypothetical protein
MSDPDVTSFEDATGQSTESAQPPVQQAQAYPDLSSARAGAREASCADFGVAVWDFNPKTRVVFSLLMGLPRDRARYVHS